MQRVIVCDGAGSGGLARLRTLSMNTRNAAERLPRFGRELWEPYLADTLLRVFASCGISGQIGTFTRPFLDFTQASVCSHHLGLPCANCNRTVIYPLWEGSHIDMQL